MKLVLQINYFSTLRNKNLTDHISIISKNGYQSDIISYFFNNILKTLIF